MSERYYVYLLVDHDPQQPENDEVFYVGKGSGSRALAHLDEALEAAGSDPDAVQRALTVDGAAAEAEPELHTKTQRIIEAVRAGRSVRIDVLRAGLSEQTAFHIESAAIDLLGVDRLANRIAGHDSQRMPLPVLQRLERAQPVALNDDLAVIVPGGGVWGGAGPVGGLLGASPTDLWENARHRWSLSEKARALLAELAAAGTPALLISVGKGPGPWSGVVLLVEEVQAITFDGPRVRGDGWAFERRGAASERLLAARARLQGQRLDVGANSGPVGDV